MVRDKAKPGNFGRSTVTGVPAMTRPPLTVQPTRCRLVDRLRSGGKNRCARHAPAGAKATRVSLAMIRRSTSIRLLLRPAGRRRGTLLDFTSPRSNTEHYGARSSASAGAATCRRLINDSMVALQRSRWPNRCIRWKIHLVQYSVGHRTRLPNPTATILNTLTNRRSSAELPFRRMEFLSGNSAENLAFILNDN